MIKKKQLKENKINQLKNQLISERETKYRLQEEKKQLQMQNNYINERINDFENIIDEKEKENKQLQNNLIQNKKKENEVKELENHIYIYQEKIEKLKHEKEKLEKQQKDMNQKNSYLNNICNQIQNDKLNAIDYIKKLERELNENNNKKNCENDLKSQLDFWIKKNNVDVKKIENLEINWNNQKII